MSHFKPLVRYHGGKAQLARWIVSQFPSHAVYCEPFGGGGSVLLAKPRATFREVYGDLDEEVVSLFRAVRDPVLSSGSAAAASWRPRPASARVIAGRMETLPGPGAAIRIAWRSSARGCRASASSGATPSR